MAQAYTPVRPVFFLLALSLSLGLAAPAKAAPEIGRSTAIGSEGPSRHNARGKRRFGAYVAALGDPYPSLAAINIAFAPADFLLFHLGAGNLLGGSTAGMGAKWMILPDKIVTPTFGLSVSRSSVSDPFAGVFSAVDHRDAEFWTASASFGMDLRTPYGFHLGLGLTASLWNTSATARPATLPYLTLGWFL